MALYFHMGELQQCFSGLWLASYSHPLTPYSHPFLLVAPHRSRIWLILVWEKKLGSVALHMKRRYLFFHVSKFYRIRPCKKSVIVHSVSEWLSLILGCRISKKKKNLSPGSSHIPSVLAVMEVLFWFPSIWLSSLLAGSEFEN